MMFPLTSDAFWGREERTGETPSAASILQTEAQEGLLEAAGTALCQRDRGP